MKNLIDKKIPREKLSEITFIKVLTMREKCM